MLDSEMVDTIAARRGSLLTKRQAQAATDSCKEIIGEQLVRGGEVRMKGIGIFRVVDTKPRRGRNPQTGEEIDIPAKRQVKFTPSKTLKDQVQAGFEEEQRQAAGARRRRRG